MCHRQTHAQGSAELSNQNRTHQSVHLRRAVQFWVWCVMGSGWNKRELQYMLRCAAMMTNVEGSRVAEDARNMSYLDYD